MDSKNPAFAEGVSRPPSRVRTRSEAVKDTLEDHGVLLRHLILTINGGTNPEGEEIQGLNHFLQTGVLQNFNEIRILRSTVLTLLVKVEELEKATKAEPFDPHTPPNPKTEEPTPRAGTTRGTHGYPRFETTTPRHPPPHRDTEPPQWGIPRGRTQ